MCCGSTSSRGRQRWYFARFDRLPDKLRAELNRLSLELGAATRRDREPVGA
jgi:hypothetical protein